MNGRYLLLASLLLLGGARTASAARLACDVNQSRIDILVKATVDSFTGHLTRFDPEVDLDADERVVAARVKFHFKDLQTGRDKRNQAMHEWQHTDQFPDGEFVLDSLSPETAGGWLARGRLTLHGQTRPLSFPVTVLTQGNLCAIDGEAALDTRDFALPVIRMMGLLKVEPVVHVLFHLQGRRDGAP